MTKLQKAIESTKGYWNIKENRMKSLLTFIETKGTFKSIMNDPVGKKLYHNFHKHGDSLRNAIIELGFDPDDLKLTTKGIYNDFSLIEQKINSFIEVNNRFPSKSEIVKKLKIDQRYIDKLGGVYEIRRKMNYFSVNDLVDDRHYINDSLLEFFVSQYLIHHDINYIRNKVIPNKSNRKYRYDYFLTDLNVYIEVWGYRENCKSSISRVYSKKRKIKESLYRDNNHTLVPIEETDINIHNIQETKNSLNVIFAEMFDTEKILPDDIFISNAMISDQDILGLISNHKDENGYLPTTNKLEEVGLGYLSRIIRKRHGSYYNYSKIINEKITFKEIDKDEITREFVFETLIKVVDVCKDDITRENLSKQTIHHYAIIEWMKERGNGNSILAKLEFYDHCIAENKSLPIPCVKFICNVANDFGVNINNIVSKDEIKYATDILNMIRVSDDYKNIVESLTYEINEKRGWSEEEYIYYFNKFSNEGFKLTPHGFNESSPTGYRVFTSYFKTENWLDIIKLMGRFGDYDLYIHQEYKNYIIESGEHNISNFVKYHKYIRNVGLMGYLTRPEWNDRIGILVKNKRYSESDLKNNFIDIMNYLKRVPLYTEFDSMTRIPLITYSNKLSLKGKVYDKIVQLYATTGEYEEYIKSKSIHKSSIGKINGSLSTKHSDEDLANNLTSIFNSHKISYGKYPSKREFVKLSNIDESTYRVRLNKSWSQVVQHYGFASNK